MPKRNISGTRFISWKPFLIKSKNISECCSIITGWLMNTLYGPLRLAVWKWHSPLSRTALHFEAAHIPLVWRGAKECRNIFPNGHLLLHPWMDPQFADGLRVFPINNTFLRRAISTLNGFHWQLLRGPFQHSCHSKCLLFAGPQEALNIPTWLTR
jgi:hypothetical protein